MSARAAVPSALQRHALEVAEVRKQGWAGGAEAEDRVLDDRLPRAHGAEEVAVSTPSLPAKRKPTLSAAAPSIRFPRRARLKAGYLPPAGEAQHPLMAAVDGIGHRKLATATARVPIGALREQVLDLGNVASPDGDKPRRALPPVLGVERFATLHRGPRGAGTSANDLPGGAVIRSLCPP